MEDSHRSFLRIGCPDCEARVGTTVPLEAAAADATRPLGGSLGVCGACGASLDAYDY